MLSAADEVDELLPTDADDDAMLDDVYVYTELLLTAME